MMFYDVLWCFMMFYGVLGCSMMFCDVPWCSMMFYDFYKCGANDKNHFWSLVTTQMSFRRSLAFNISKELIYCSVFFCSFGDIFHHFIFILINLDQIVPWRRLSKQCNAVSSRVEESFEFDFWHLHHLWQVHPSKCNWGQESSWDFHNGHHRLLQISK